MCTAHKVCGAGEWTFAKGTATKDTACRPCREGTFRAKAPTDGRAETEGEVCLAHNKCEAGEWTSAKGDAKTDTTCTKCKDGHFRDTAPSGKTKEIENEVCSAHKTCVAGEWTSAEGDAKTDTKCTPCEDGHFRATAPSAKTKETEDKCIRHQICKAGQWTSAVGTRVKDTVCTGCAAGTARAKAPASSTPLESASSCTACAEKSVYSDEVGLAQCKKCPIGHFGVIVTGSNGEGGHKACDDDTCERPTSLPANSVLVGSKCPEHGKQQRGTWQAASNCTLSCATGFYSSASSTPFKCLPDGESTTASYQGGQITCTGEHVLLVWSCVCYIATFLECLCIL